MFLSLGMVLLLLPNLAAQVQELFLKWHHTSLYTWNSSCDGRMHTNPHCLNLPWVGVHTNMLDVLQFLLGLVLSIVRCLMWFPLACRCTSHPTNKLFVAHQSCADEIKNTVFLSDLYCKDYNCKLSDLVNEEATIACLLFCHQRPSVNHT